MGLALYHSPSPDAIIDVNSPLVFTFDGRVPAIQQKLIYIRNDDPDKWYDTITLALSGILTGDNQYVVWKFAESDFPLTEEAWLVIDPNATLSLAETIGTTDGENVITFFPIWIHVETTRKLKIQTITSITFTVSAHEYNIGEIGEGEGGGGGGPVG